LRSVRAFLTIACLAANVVWRKFRKVSVATCGRSSSSAAEMPFLITTGLFVEGDIVVIVSTDMLCILCCKKKKKKKKEEEDLQCRMGGGVKALQRRAPLWYPIQWVPAGTRKILAPLVYLLVR
jgi:hypothetical protein